MDDHAIRPYTSTWRLFTDTVDLYSRTHANYSWPRLHVCASENSDVRSTLEWCSKQHMPDATTDSERHFKVRTVHYNLDCALKLTVTDGWRTSTYRRAWETPSFSSHSCTLSFSRNCIEAEVSVSLWRNFVLNSKAAGMVHSVSGWTGGGGVQVKLWDPLGTRAIPERLRGVFRTRRYTNSRLPLPLIRSHRILFWRLSLSHDFVFSLYPLHAWLYPSSLSSKFTHNF